MLFAYSTKISIREQRSEKVAIMEGVMGLGLMIGSSSSGHIWK